MDGCLDGGRSLEHCPVRLIGAITAFRCDLGSLKLMLRSPRLMSIWVRTTSVLTKLLNVACCLN